MNRFLNKEVNWILYRTLYRVASLKESILGTNESPTLVKFLNYHFPVISIFLSLNAIWHKFDLYFCRPDPSYWMFICSQLFTFVANLCSFIIFRNINSYFRTLLPLHQPAITNLSNTGSKTCPINPRAVHIL